MPAVFEIPPVEPTTLAYIAGLIDGEGTITIVRRKRSRNALRSDFIGLVTVVQKKRMILDWMRDALGCGTVVIHNKRSVRIMHRWDATSNIAYQLVKMIRPYLRVKAGQADILIAYQEAKIEWANGSMGGRRRKGYKGTVPTPPELLARYADWLEQIQSLNGHNHPKILDWSQIA